MGTSSDQPTLVLVHGAGDRADVWAKVQQSLAARSLALDLPGRGKHPFDLSAVTVDLAVRLALQDIDELTSGPVVLVAHSIGGALSPGILAGLGSRAVRLVHIAAVAAPDGELPLRVASEEFVRHLLGAADQLRETAAGLTFTAPGEHVAPPLRPTEDVMLLAQLDALTFGCTPTSWAGVDAGLPRTFVQPLGDRMYPPEAQLRMASAVGAERIEALDTGHNVARSAPVELAALLNVIASHSAQL
jgi:pimeloyl-ACP methyl ester carboxylesterase